MLSLACLFWQAMPGKIFQAAVAAFGIRAGEPLIINGRCYMGEVDRTRRFDDAYAEFSRQQEHVGALSRSTIPCE